MKNNNTPSERASTLHFFHIGAGKCQSTYLWKVCLEHPDIFVHSPRPDNLNFFLMHYQRGMDWYRETYYSNYGGEPIVGEFSNSYICNPLALERVKKHFPDARLTLTIKNPIRRALLTWAEQQMKGKYGLDAAKGQFVPFEKALKHGGHGWFSQWIWPGMYAYHLENNVYPKFPPEQVQIMFYDDLIADKQNFLSRFFSFVGADPSLIK